MKIANIPTNNLTAALAILGPYVPELSPTGLIQALRNHDPNPRKSTPRLLTKYEVAEILGVSWFTVVNHAKAGKLPGKKLPGGQWRFEYDKIINMARGEA